MNELLNKQLNTKRKAKGVKPDVQAGISYNADLQRIVRQINKDVKRIVKLAEPPGYVRDSWADTLSNQIANIRARWTSSAFSAFANQIATKFVQTSNRTNARKNGTDFGINVYGGSPELVDNLNLSIKANVSLIESIPEQYLTQVESIVMSNARAGNRPSVISKQLVKQFGITERRAKMIARDQTAKLNGDLNRIRQTDAGFPYFEWVDSDDERVRDRHEFLTDHVTAYGKGIYRWDNPPLSSEGVPIIPGSDYQCFPGSLQLDNTTFCNKLYRRWYTGELSELVFSDGTVLSSTTNHPILTDRGFKPAHLIDSSDNVIRTFNESFLSVKLNSEGVKPTFEQIFSAFNLLGVEHSVPSHIGGEFHGDISDGDINVIELNSLLVSVVNPSITQLFDELEFTDADKMIVFNAFSCFGNFDFSVKTTRDTFNSFMSINNLKMSLFFGKLTPLQGFGLALGTWYDVEPFKLSADNISGRVEMFSDCVFAFSVLIHGNHLFTEIVNSFSIDHFGSLNSKIIDRTTYDTNGNTSGLGCERNGLATTYKVDSVVNNNTVSFSGHVYNLQSISGDYNTCSTVVSNCRCIARPVSQEEVDANVKAGRVVKGVLR